MYKYILSEAGNINWMALFSLVTFFLLFSLTLVLVFFKKKDDYKHMAELPLDDNYENTDKNEA